MQPGVAVAFHRGAGTNCLTQCTPYHTCTTAATLRRSPRCVTSTPSAYLDMLQVHHSTLTRRAQQTHLQNRLLSIPICSHPRAQVLQQTGTLPLQAAAWHHRSAQGRHPTWIMHAGEPFKTTMLVAPCTVCQPLLLANGCGAIQAMVHCDHVLSMTHWSMCNLRLVCDLHWLALMNTWMRHTHTAHHV